MKIHLWINFPQKSNINHVVQSARSVAASDWDVWNFIHVKTMVRFGKLSRDVSAMFKF